MAGSLPPVRAGSPPGRDGLRGLLRLLCCRNHLELTKLFTHAPLTRTVAARRVQHISRSIPVGCEGCEGGCIGLFSFYKPNSAFACSIQSNSGCRFSLYVLDHSYASFSKTSLLSFMLSRIPSDVNGFRVTSSCATS
jgi:hypothetical protein